MDPAHSSSVLPIARGRSGVLARSAADLLSTKVIEPATGHPMTEAGKAELAGIFTVMLDANARPGRAAVGWGVAAFLAFALVVVGGVITWDRISSIETKLDADTHYGLTLANYLVVKAHNDYSNSVNADQLLRALAAAQNIKTGHIPAPVQSPPPASVQRRSAEHREGQGE